MNSIQPPLDSDFESLLNWMRTLVFHFIAKRLLELHCRDLQTLKYPISITILTSNHPVLRFPSWRSICDVIKRLLPSHDNRYDNLVQAFEVQVRHAVLLGDAAKSADAKFLVSFSNSLKAPDNQVIMSQHLCDKFPGTLHCEAVLAAMALYPDRAIQDKDPRLRDIAQVVSSPDSFSKSDPILKGIALWGCQGVKAMLSGLFQAFPLFNGDI
jgi:hypothetical protein